MKTILFNRREILFDDSDFDTIVACIRSGENICKVNHRYVGFTRFRVPVPFHDILLGKAPNGLETDHIDRNTYNNQRNNLRHVTHSQNSQNVGLRINNSTGFKGVAVRPNGYGAEIIINGIRYWRGKFKTAKEAAIAYDNLAIVYGSNAPTNKSLGLL